jgi:hypothetical protein
VQGLFLFDFLYFAGHPHCQEEPAVTNHVMIIAGFERWLSTARFFPLIHASTDARV